jgi:hypothetical protein
MQCRNRLWKNEKPSDVTIIRQDGSVKVIPMCAVPKPAIVEHAEIETERDSERYIEWRTAILKRDRKTCILCGSKQWIQVHHIERWADNKAKRYDLQNGICLCIPCHQKHHGPEMLPFPNDVTATLLVHIHALYGGRPETTRCADNSIPAH